MADLLNYNQTKQFKEIITEVIAEKLGDNFLERFGHMEQNIDATAKMIADDRDELDITKVRVSNLDARVTTLESTLAN